MANAELTATAYLMDTADPVATADLLVLNLNKEATH